MYLWQRKTSIKIINPVKIIYLFIFGERALALEFVNNSYIKCYIILNTFINKYERLIYIVVWYTVYQMLKNWIEFKL